MTTISVRALDQVLEATISPKIASGNRETVLLRVDFSEHWDGFAKSAVFYTSKNPVPYSRPLSVNGLCTIPSEVLADECRLFISVQGVNTSTGAIKATLPVKYKVDPGAPPLVVSDPTPDVYQELLTAYSKVGNELAVERARIDALLKLEEGSTTGDAELQDIRIGIDGNAYNSAGAAVRQQANALENAKQRKYGSFIAAEVSTHENVVYQVETKTEQAQTNGYYAEYAITDEIMLLVTGCSWSSYSIFPLGAFYDSDGNLIKKIGFSACADYKKVLVYVPSGAAALIINGKAWYEPAVEKFVPGDLEADISEIKLNIAAKIAADKMKNHSAVDREAVEIALTEDNTELLEAQMYDSWGNLTDGALSTGTYDTLYFAVGSFSTFLLDNYAVGTYGGAFLDENKNWLSSFATDYPNNLDEKSVPVGAHYIAITVSAANRYKAITAYRKTYKLDGLRVFSDNIVGDWSGKKIVWIGTSVSFGQYAEKAYPTEAANRLGFDLVNCSVPGLAIHTDSAGAPLTYGSLAMTKAEYVANGWDIPDAPIDYVPGGSYNNYYRTYENVFSADNADADLYVFDIAPNNSDFSTTDWDAFDFANWRYTDGSDFANHRATFFGALLFLMDKMYSLNENARMIFVLGSGFAYYDGKTAFQKVKDKWNIPVVDLWGKMNTSPKSLAKLKSKNGTDSHPSTYAHEIMGRILAGEMQTIG